MNTEDIQMVLLGFAAFFVLGYLVAAARGILKYTGERHEPRDLKGGGSGW